EGRLWLMEYDFKHFGRTARETDPTLLTPVPVMIDPPRDDGRVRNITAPLYGIFYSIDYTGERWILSHMRSCRTMHKEISSAYHLGKPNFRRLYKMYYKCAKEGYLDYTK